MLQQIRLCVVSPPPVLQHAKPLVTGVTEQTADCACLMVVIHMKTLLTWEFVADRAHTPLSGKHQVVLNLRDPVPENEPLLEGSRPDVTLVTLIEALVVPSPPVDWNRLILLTLVGPIASTAPRGPPCSIPAINREVALILRHATAFTVHH
jgi:hypothetical protein